MGPAFDFDQLSFPQLQSARLSARPIAGNGLRDRTLIVRTRRGNVAKMRVSAAGDMLFVDQLSVYTMEACLLRKTSGLAVRVGQHLDVESGRVARTGGDLRWNAGPGTKPLLEPLGGASVRAFRDADLAPAKILRPTLRDGYDAESDPVYQSAADRVRFRPVSQAAMQHYADLLESEPIRAALVFQDKDGVHSYDEWTEARKAQLSEFLYLRESGQDFPISGPPHLDHNGAMSLCAAWKIYLAHVAQSFWVDAHQRVVWRLADASAEHLEYLLDGRRLLASTTDGHRSLAMGVVTPWCPVFAYRFMVDNGYVGETQWQTVQHLVDWARDNLQHIWGYQYNQPGGPFDSQEDQWDYLFGYRGPPPVDKMIDPLPGRDHVTHACSGTSAFLAAVLRTVNIPTRHGYTDYGSGNHHRPEFFSVNRNLPHGDDPYDTATKPGVNTVPIRRIFYTDAELENLIDAPDPLPGKSVAETAHFNAIGRRMALAVEYKTDWLLTLRCDDQASGASGPESALGEVLRDYYSVEEIAQIEADCDAVLAGIENGCTVVRGY